MTTTTPSRPIGLTSGLLSVCLGLGALGLTANAGHAASLPAANACFPAAALVGSPQEKIVQRGNRAFDVAPPKMALPSLEPLPTALRGSVRRVELPPGRKLIALTFDFCESTGEIAGYDGAIMDYLRAQGVKATLFLGGKWMLSHHGRAQQVISDPLFEIGSHGWAHRNVRGLSGAALRQEIEGPSAAYSAIRGELAGNVCLKSAATSPTPGIGPQAAIRLMRFPFGACSAEAMAATNDLGLIAVQWSLATGDPSPGQSAAAIAHAMVSEAKPGAIVINHGNGRGWHTAEALPMAIPKLKAMGYEFVTVSELLAAGKPVTTPTCYDSRPGDVDKYDFLFQVGRSASEKAAVLHGSLNPGPAVSR